MNNTTTQDKGALWPVIRELIHRALGHGGCTLDAMGNPVSKGYAVGKGGAQRLSPMRSYFDQVEAIVLAGLDSNSVYPQAYGSWIEQSTGDFYVEPVDIVDDEETALALGTYRKEIAIFDLNRGVEIPLSGVDAPQNNAQ